MPTGGRLSEATWPEVTDAADVLVVPVGSCEQHGPHLPMDTDTTIAVAVTDQVVARLRSRGVAAWAGPALSLGSSGEHQHFAGTLSLGTPALQQIVVELARSARSWVPEVVIVNAHGGNAVALTRAVEQLTAEGHRISWFPCRTESVDLHAGRTETSLMLYLRPTAVRLNRAEAGNTAPLAEILPAMIAGGVRAVSPNGVLGDPTGANAKEGAAMLEEMAAEITELVAGRVEVRA